MLYELISQEDREKIDSYIRAFANDEAEPLFCYCRLERLLREWKKSKANLAKLFDGKLIISKEFVYDKQEYAIDADIANLINRKNSFISEFYELYQSMRQTTWKPSILNNLPQFTMPVFDDFINYDNLINNTYLGNDFVIEIEGHKKITIRNKEKMLKAIGKMVNELFPELKDTFEQFRIDHSMAIGRKETVATVNLSIHPLDFMTMSDSPYFSSCMNWQKNGCYRQGTIEMMNSPVIIMAYISGSKPMKWEDSDRDITYSWNGKRWRELFIVSEDLISNIKGYPFEADGLDIQILEWIKELVNSHNIFQSNFTSNIRTKDEIMYGSIEYRIITNWMYNDYKLQTNRLKFDIVSDRLLAQKKPLLSKKLLALNYSGARECMCCGQLNFTDYESEESHLICDECGGRTSWDDDYDE